MYATLAFRNIFRNRTRSVITLLVIVTGCVSMIISSGFVEDTSVQVRESYIRDFLGHLRIYRRGYRDKGILHPFDYLIDQPDLLLKQAASNPHIRIASPRLQFAGLVSTGDTSVSFFAQGIDPDKDQMMRNTTRMIDGVFLENARAYEVMVGKGLAKALLLKKGDPLILMANTARGAINAIDVTVKSIFGTVDKGFDDRAIRVPLLIAQKLLRTQGVETIVLFLDDTANVDLVKKALGEQFKREGLDYEVRAWYELEESDFVTKLVAVYQGINKVMKMIILFVVTLGIVNTMNMAVLERVGEIGTLMALGTKRSGIALLFIFEGLFLGILGGLLGCLAGLALALVISKVGIEMPTPPGTTIRWIAHIAITPNVFVPAFAMALITSLISSVIPAMKAARLEIAQALRHNI